MSVTIENPFIQVELLPAIGRWNVTPRHSNQPFIDNIQLHAKFKYGHKRLQSLDRWVSPSISDPVLVTSPHGPMRQIQILLGSDRGNLDVTITFALPDQIPLLLWNLSVKNQGTQSANIEKLELFSAGFIYKNRIGPAGNIYLSRIPIDKRKSKSFTYRSNQLPLIAGKYAFYSNGWQSWSYTGVYFPDDRYRHTHLGPLRIPATVNPFTPHPNRAGMFGSDMFGVMGELVSRNAVLLGFLSQKQHFGSIEALTKPFPALRLWANGDNACLEPGMTMTTDWACLQFLHLDNPDPLSVYLDAAAREHGLKIQNIDHPKSHESRKLVPTGWCSWNQFSTEEYTNSLTENNILDNLIFISENVKRLPVRFIQIDAGYESQVGDWFNFDNGFPSGVAPLASEIRSNGFTPGLWLAPFIVDPRSKLTATHPDWLIRNKLGRPVNAGYQFGRIAHGLDLTHPDALAYIGEVVRTAVQEWQFAYLKLDFLYAAALCGQHQNATLTRAQILRLGLRHIRETAGDDVFILGCGCPIGSAIGLVDAMRIGADVGRRWNASFKGIELFFKNEPDFPSTRWSTHNAITRAPLHRRWWINDPDCLLLRPSTKLTLAEVQSLATTIALTGGSMLVSDHLPDLPAERLRIAQVILPVIDKRPFILDWFDSPTPSRLQLDLEGASGHWNLLALFNWSDSIKDIQLKLQDFYLDSQIEYFAREFWSGRNYLIKNGLLEFTGLPPHSVVLVCTRPFRPYQPQYLGSGLHISQGLEVTSWKSLTSGLEFEIQRPGISKGVVDLHLPKPPRTAQIDSQEIYWKTINENIYRFELQFTRKAHLKINY